MNVNPAPAAPAVAAPRCAHLRTKAMYISAMSADAFRADEPAPLCWCNRTLGELGPDREPADLQPCSDAARSCYQASPAQR